MKSFFKILAITILVVISLVFLLFLHFYLNPHPHDTSTYRNGRRLVLVRLLVRGLEIYFQDHKTYPNDLSELSPNYIVVSDMPSFSANGLLIPRSKTYCDPNEQYSYERINDGKSYLIKVCLPESDSEYTGGYHVAGPNGVK
mgnify:CR=1 FL=1